ncbi:hypothetical protein PF008_g9042 [Phytophthora fragariae]|uniref:Pectate lyase n=1 Tax=Phytophthora fragariae TaxID=53985 RepID=A0A6G0RYU0_9STRA|nr:hypothetical protein PF008_g9042 [Phytophthora fragariae]
MGRTSCPIAFLAFSLSSSANSSNPGGIESRFSDVACTYSTVSDTADSFPIVAK